MTLRGQANAMRRDGSTPEVIGRAMHAALRQLCRVFKERTPEPRRTRISERAQTVYGDPPGPSTELLQLRGGNWEHLIASASRPGLSPLEDSSSSDVGEA